MQTLVEIYDLQQQLKHRLSQKQYQDLEVLFAPLTGQDLQKTLNIQFIFNPEVDDTNVILSHLHSWQQATPDSYYPYVFLASFWHRIANNERGIQTMDSITPGQHLRFSIANDQLFYWALKALEFNAECIAACHLLLEASGRFGTPDWLELPVTQPLYFSCADYNQEASAYLSLFTAYSVPHSPICLTLPSPTVDEQRFIPFYWLRNILAIDPNHIESRKIIIRLLSPRWYGDEKYKSVDHFLAGHYCSGLSELQINILEREKEFDRLTSYHTLPLTHYRKALKKREKQFRSFLAAPLTKQEDSLALFEYIHFSYHVLMTFPEKRKKSNDNRVKDIYQTLHHIVKLASPWILFYQAHDIFHQLISLMKLYEFEDSLNVFEDLARHTRYRNLTSSIEVLYSALAANVPLANILLSAERERIEHYYLLSEHNFDYYSFRMHIFILCAMGYAASIKSVLEKFAIEHRAINASILFYEIYNGNTPGLANMLMIKPDAEKAPPFLATAIQQGSSQAILIKSRDLEDVIERSSNPSEQSALAAEREKLLKFNIHRGDAVSQYDYACSLIASSEAQQIHQGLFIEAPKVLSEGRVRMDQMAYIAYLYAFCSFNARGMSKNLYLVDFWIHQAMTWAPDINYFNFLVKVKEGLAFRPMYRYYLKRDKEKVSEEMKKIMNDVML